MGAHRSLGLAIYIACTTLGDTGWASCVRIAAPTAFFGWKRRWPSADGPLGPICVSPEPGRPAFPRARQEPIIATRVARLYGARAIQDEQTRPRLRLECSHVITDAWLS